MIPVKFSGLGRNMGGRKRVMDCSRERTSLQRQRETWLLLLVEIIKTGWGRAGD